MTPEQHHARRVAVAKWRAEGLSTGQIAVRLGINHRSLNQWIRVSAPDLAAVRKHPPVDQTECRRRRAIVKQGIAEGLRMADIAERIGLSVGGLQHWLRNYAPDLGGSWLRLSPDELARRHAALAKARETGATIGEVADQLGVQSGNFHRWVRRYEPDHPGLPEPAPEVVWREGPRRSEAILGAQSWRVTSYAVADSWRVDCHVCLRRFTRESKTRADRLADAHARMHHLPPTVAERGLTIWGHRQPVAA